MPKVSVILPAYNGEKYIERAILSVLAQNYTDWELVAVNDGSVDGTLEILEKFKNKESRLKIIIHEKNSGLIVSLNDALAVSGGEYIARIDCDDVWSSQDKLKKQVEFLDQHQDYGLVGTWAEFTDMQGKHLKDYKLPTKDAGIRSQILLRNCIVHSSILARKNILISCGGYSPLEKHVEDYGLWLRMGLRCRLANLPEFMVKYGVNESGITRTKNAEQIGRILELIEKFGQNYPNYHLGVLKWRWQKLFAK